eukprot:sb/3477842/
MGQLIHPQLCTNIPQLPPPSFDCDSQRYVTHNVDYNTECGLWSGGVSEEVETHPCSGVCVDLWVYPCRHKPAMGEAVRDPSRRIHSWQLGLDRTVVSDYRDCLGA